MIFKLRAETDIWTGDWRRENTTLQLTGLLGSIRWWAEALVRSFGLHACDPTNSACKQASQLCVICRLFGNAGVMREHKSAPLAAKFALRCWDPTENGEDPRQTVVRTKGLAKGEVFFLEFHFYRERLANKPEDQEGELYMEPLLARTLDIIARYGSLGGKTVLKPALDAPSDSRAGRRTGATNDVGQKASSKAVSPKAVAAEGAPFDHHHDYGIVSLLDVPASSSAAQHENLSTLLQKALPQYPRALDVTLPNLNNFWFVPGRTFYVHPAGGEFAINELLGLEESSHAEAVPHARRPRASNNMTLEEDQVVDALRKELRGAPTSSKVTKEESRQGGLVLVEATNRVKAENERLQNQGMTQPRSKRFFSFNTPSRSWGYVLHSNLLVHVEPLMKSVGVMPSEIVWGRAIKDGEGP